MAKKIVKKIKKHRSAETGRYITEDYAKKHPKTTVKETQKVVVKKTSNK